jgi:ElaB/YqjD/DUF883 family membrane-anchored ribosome-binding protein
MATQIAGPAEKILTPNRPGMEGGDVGANALVEKAELVKERARNLYQRTRERAVELEGDFEGYVKEHPVKSVLLASAIGAGVGLLVGVLVSRK